MRDSRKCPDMGGEEGGTKGSGQDTGQARKGRKQRLGGGFEKGLERGTDAGTRGRRGGRTKEAAAAPPRSAPAHLPPRGGRRAAARRRRRRRRQRRGLPAAARARKLRATAAASGQQRPAGAPTPPPCCRAPPRFRRPPEGLDRCRGNARRCGAPVTLETGGRCLGPSPSRPFEHFFSYYYFPFQKGKISPGRGVSYRWKPAPGWVTAGPPPPTARPGCGRPCWSHRTRRAPDTPVRSPLPWRGPRLLGRARRFPSGVRDGGGEERPHRSCVCPPTLVQMEGMPKERPPPCQCVTNQAKPAGTASTLLFVYSVVHALAEHPTA